MLGFWSGCIFANAVGHSVSSLGLIAVVNARRLKEGNEIFVSASLSLVMVGVGFVWPCVGGEPGP